MNKYFSAIFLVLLCHFTKADNKDTTTIRKPSTTKLSDLAFSLSSNTKNDSERVANIFYWVAHTVAWDTKSFNKEEKLKFRSSAEVLRSKTGKPREFAALIKDLCEMAGIKAFVIPGYEKNELYEDGASFYMPNHTWNAVLIGNNWLLLDAYDAAGNIYMDLNWWKRKMQKLHKKKLYTSTKVKFKFDYDPQHLFVDPEEFRLTRVPIDPIWQLSDTILPLSIFEKTEEDIRTFNEKYSANKPFSIKLSEVYNLTDDEYIIECADRTYRYNPRYTEMKANKYIALANEKMKTISRANNQVEAQARVKESKTDLDTAKNVLTAQKKEITKEYTELRKVNMEKRTDVIKYKQSFTSVNNKHISALNSRITASDGKSSGLNSDSKNKTNRLNDIDGKAYQKASSAGSAKRENDREVLQLKDSIMKRTSRISLLKEEINFNKNKIASLKSEKDQIIDSMNIYIKLSDSAFYKEAVARSRKQDSFDDSIKSLRTKLYFYKVNKLDSFQTAYIEVYDDLLSDYELIKKHYAFIIEASKKNTKDIEQLKRLNDKNNMDAAFNTNHAEYTEAVRNYVNNNLSTQNFLKGEYKSLQQMKKVYTTQNRYFNYLSDNEDERKEYVKKMLDKSEDIDKKHNEQKKEIVNNAKDDLEQEFQKVKKKKKKSKKDA